MWNVRGAKMRILLVHEDSVVKRASGSTRYAEYFLNQENLDVDVLHKGPAMRVGKNTFFSFFLNMPHIRGLNETILPVIRYYRTRKHIRDKVKLLEILYDLIHSNTVHIADYLSVSEKPTVITFHGVAATECKYVTNLEKMRTEYHALNSEKNVLTKKTDKLAKIVAVSDLIKRELQSEYDVPADKIRVIHNGIDTELDKPTTDDPTGDYFLYVGRLDKRKGFYELFDVMKKLPDQKFVVISSIYKYGKPSKYSKALCDLSKKQNNIMIKPNISDEDLKRYYSNAIATILPSRYDPFPYTVLESMACGTPCIVSSNSGSVEAIGKYGAVFQAGSSTSLKEAIESLSYPDTWRQEVRKRVENLFSVDVFMNKILSLYKEVIEEHTGI